MMPPPMPIMPERIAHGYAEEEVEENNHAAHHSEG